MQLHPGLGASLGRFDYDETQLARALAHGEVPSPQRFGKSTYFRIRLSGTGLSYRPQLDEYVVRPEEHYLSPDEPELPSFAARCNGLPVIWVHPPNQSLDTEEFRRRIVGTVVLPYVGTIDGEDSAAKEVWGVARILDDEAAQLMVAEQLSTSPAVTLPPDSGERVPIEDGKHHILIENRPRAVDHVAIVRTGVWDGIDGANGPGIDNGSTVKESGSAGKAEEDTMAEQETEEERKAREEEADAKKRRDDAAGGETPDPELKELIVDGFRRVHDRMDAMDDDNKRRDARMDAMDRTRDDAADPEDPEKEREQAATLERLAVEEEEEAQRLEKEADACKDDARPHWMRKRDDESEDEHSERVDRVARRDDSLTRYRRRDDEKKDDHSKRADAIARRHDVRRDDATFHPPHHHRDDHRDNDDMRRRDDESASAHSDRVHAAAGKRDDRKHLMRRDGETRRAHSDRADAACRRDDDDARHKADAAREAELADLKRMVREQGSRLAELSRERSDEDRAALASAQSRADECHMAFLGKQAPPPMRAETLRAYRVRLLRPLQEHSERWNKANLDTLSREDSTFAEIEGQIYADSAAKAREPNAIQDGLRKIVETDHETGQRMIKWVGSPRAWMSPMMPPYQVAINRH